MDDDRRNQLLATYRDGLLNDVLPFWTRHAVDREHGGFLTSLDRDGTVVDTDKSLWPQGRFAWLLGELYNSVEPREEWLELARHGVEFLDRHAVDPVDGRMWFAVTRDGRPLRKRRYAFTESFAAIAYGEYAQATGRDEYAAKAEAAFRRFVEHGTTFRDPSPKWTDTRPTAGLGGPMITIVTASELRDSIGLEDADALIDEAIETIRTKHVNADLRCVLETVSPEGEPIDSFDGRTLNPGHAIEGAWFTMKEGRRRGDNALVQLGLTMLDWTWKRGWDAEHGGMLYFTSTDGRPVQEYWHDMKFWWPHNEAIIATLLAYTLTGDSKYAAWHALVHDWAHERFADPEHGEWFGYLHRDGTPSSSLKGNWWKGPFHLPRMQLECWRLLAEPSPAWRH
ncbi:AGE family epimerase/isomerase [Alienimonas chondri]|uniref:Cellobiose 2-epimerase n=1 Tax=Alienimonas chondri TaxID=2681879 RepID=A0ABX1V7T0_9PLAN|nr:AGE family epimerase/isomerase [Alienimonas chondri]NNJ24101.1 Cellobiose 2-epimerase [Alienimonas chondri]